MQKREEKYKYVNKKKYWEPIKKINKSKYWFSKMKTQITNIRSEGGDIILQLTVHICTQRKPHTY
jgi:hypothetical protein